MRGRVQGTDGPIGRAEVYSWQGERSTVLARTRSAADGAFELTEDIPHAELALAREHGRFLAARWSDACSHAAYVPIDGGDESDGFVVLHMRPAAVVQGVLQRRDGTPASGGECIVRWRLPDRAPVPEETGCPAAPRHLVVTCDARGRFEFTVPPGLLWVWGRESPDGALGAPVKRDVAAGSNQLPTLRAGGASSDLVIRILDESGQPIPRPVVCFPESHFGHLVASRRGTSGDDRCIRGADEGTVLIRCLGGEVHSLELVVGAPGFVESSVPIGGRASGETRVVLTRKVQCEARVVRSNGDPLSGVPIKWTVTVDDRDFLDRMSRAGVEFEAPHPIALMREIVPPLEVLAGPSAGTCRFALPRPVDATVQAAVMGGVFLRRSLRATDMRHGAAVELPLGAGRTVGLAWTPSSEAGVANYAWRLRLQGVLEGGNSRHGAPVFPNAMVPIWSPSQEDPDLTLWCPDSVRALSLSGATCMDLPTAPVSVPLPATDGRVTVPAPGLADAGWLRLMPPDSSERIEEPRTVLVTPAGSRPSLRPRGSRLLRVIPGGTDRLPLPPGTYELRFVRAGRLVPWKQITVPPSKEVVVECPDQTVR